MSEHAPTARGPLHNEKEAIAREMATIRASKYESPMIQAMQQRSLASLTERAAKVEAKIAEQDAARLRSNGGTR